MTSSTLAPEAALTHALHTYAEEVVRAIGTATRYAAQQGRAPSGDAQGVDALTRLEDVVDGLVAGGGKLVRPRVAYLGHLAAAPAGDDVGRPGTDPGSEAADDAIVRLGCALELLHVFGLLQDDVMDEAATRRGRPAAHRALSDVLLTRADGAGRPEDHAAADRFGESLAVLAGDLAFALAGRQLRGLPGPVLDVWDDMVLELVQGQRLDIVYAAEGRYDDADTSWVAMAKSGAYTVARPLRLGALLARPDRTPPSWLTAYGDHLGHAFALADDILGVWGDPARTGKPVGDDIRQAKPTTVLGIADGLLGGRVAERLHPARGLPSPAEVEALMADLERHGVRAAAEDRLDQHLRAAEAELDHVTDPVLRTALTDLARALVVRES